MECNPFSQIKFNFRVPLPMLFFCDTVLSIIDVVVDILLFQDIPL